MKCKWLVLVPLTMSGCDVVFGLERDDATGSGHDEDGDGIGDLDDGCPADVGESGDFDNDRIPNVCDPTSDPEQLVLFDPLTDATGTWSGPSAWQFGADSITKDLRPVGIAEISREIAPLAYPSIEATLTYTPDPGLFVGVAVEVAGQRVKCYVSIDTAGAQHAYLYIGADQRKGTDVTGTGPVHLTLTQLRDNTYRCRVRRDNETAIELGDTRVVAGTAARLIVLVESTMIEVTSIVLWTTTT